MANPYFKKEYPCSMLIDEIESIWSKIAQQDDWSAFEAKINEIREMGRLYGFAQYNN